MNKIGCMYTVQCTQMQNVLMFKPTKKNGKNGQKVFSPSRRNGTSVLRS